MTDSISLIVLADPFALFLLEDDDDVTMPESFPSAILNEDGEHNMLCKVADVPESARGKGLIQEPLAGIQIIQEVSEDENEDAAENTLLLFMSKTASALYEKNISVHILSGYDYDYVFVDEEDLQEFLLIAGAYFKIEKE